MIGNRVYQGSKRLAETRPRLAGLGLLGIGSLFMQWGYLDVLHDAKLGKTVSVHYEAVALAPLAFILGFFMLYYGSRCRAWMDEGGRIKKTILTIVCLASMFGAVGWLEWKLRTLGYR